jgi:hypothetical protein
MGPNGGSVALDSDRNSAKKHKKTFFPTHLVEEPRGLGSEFGKKQNKTFFPTHLVEEPRLFVKVGELALVDDIGRHHLLQLPLLGGRHPGHLLLCPDK